MTDKSLLVCWHAHRAGVRVLTDTLRLLKEKDFPIAKVLFLFEGRQDDKASLQRAIKEEPGSPAVWRDVHIDYVPLSLESPTNHPLIYDLLSKQLPKWREQYADWAWHINVSPGTPAMHACWLVLYAAGQFPDGTRLWSSQRIKGAAEQADTTSIEEVTFPVTTYLQAIRRDRARSPTASLSYHNPQTVRSVERRLALETALSYIKLPRVPVLVLGARGIGKTQLINTLVRAHLEGTKPFISVACGNLTSELGESTLFGHEKGAFTGAVKQKRGLVELAHNGVLYLDELQDMERPLQRKLMRVLQDREFNRLGDDEKTLQSDFKLIASSNRSIAELREILDADFFDRVSHLVVTLPSLTSCRDDLMHDWDRLFAVLSQDIVGREIPLPHRQRLEQILRSHPLRGNFRDLESLAYLFMVHGAGLPLSGDQFESCIRTWLSSHPFGHPQELVASAVAGAAAGGGAAGDVVAGVAAGGGAAGVGADVGGMDGSWSPVPAIDPALFESGRDFADLKQLVLGGLARQAVAYYGTQQRAARALGTTRQTLARALGTGSDS
ncbi:MAG: sigma 54-interacting transcriptional regulator [Alphaproteobacteria bacterium]|nr:sigma 54-interacting transcriptional regulator [Alphaproteobacteria bacterium]